MNSPLISEPELTERSTLRPKTVGFFVAALVVIAGGAIAFEYIRGFGPAPKAQTAAVASIDAFADIAIIGDAAIVVDIPSGKVLYQKNPDVQLPLASLTKVGTALAVNEVLRPDEILTIDSDATSGSSADRLRQGERWSVEDILDFTLITSSNRGAELLAAAADARLHERYPASTPGEAALWRMNDLAANLGLSRTYFLNVSGLDMSATQSGAYGSASDMAKLFSYAASAQADLFSGTAENGKLLTAVGGESTSALNTNDAQGAISGLIMGKTGFTDLAGGNLAVVFDIGLAHPVVAVVLGSTQGGRFTDIEKLVAAARASIASTQ